VSFLGYWGICFFYSRLGGGLITGPLFMQFKVTPKVATTSSAFMILLTSSVTSFQYVVLGLVSVDYAICFGIFSFFGSLIGQFGFSYIVNKFGRQSLIIFLLNVVIAVCIGSLYFLI
jgi:uncharacterized membrane protein YfcA